MRFTEPEGAQALSATQPKPASRSAGKSSGRSTGQRVAFRNERGNVLKFRDAANVSTSPPTRLTDSSQVVQASGWESRTAAPRGRSTDVVPSRDTDTWTPQRTAQLPDVDEEDEAVDPEQEESGLTPPAGENGDTPGADSQDEDDAMDRGMQDDDLDSDQLEAEDPGLKDLGRARTKTPAEICREQQEACAKTRAKYRNNPISTIGLDITPGYKRGGSITSLVDEEEKRKKLAEATVRTWTNRHGETVAVGRIQDFRNRHVYVETEDGSVTRISFEDLGADDLCYFAETWGIPIECTIDEDMLAARNWSPSTFTWKASALCNKPLYFEEMQLERYGHTTLPLVQPALSGAHFFVSVAALPYKVGMNPPHECLYALGYYRPGNCAPWVVRPIPISLRGALLEAGAVTGGIFALP